MSKETRRARKRPRGPRGSRVIVCSSSSSSSDDEWFVDRSLDDPSRRPNYVFRRGASTVSIAGDPFCEFSENGNHNNSTGADEEADTEDTEWNWDNSADTLSVVPTVNSVHLENSEVWFHKDYSCGTAAVRGSMPMLDGQHYWEIKMISPVYGTDMMVGVCTDELDLTKYRNKFCSLLGLDLNSWGLSYTGIMQYNNVCKRYCTKFGQNTVVGVHLDMWSGKLAFYINRQPLGVAFKGLQGKKIFPVVCSTAARTGMKIVKTRSFPSSLQFLCCEAIRRHIPKDLKVLAVLDLPPGLQSFLHDNLGWLLDTCVGDDKKELCTTGTQTHMTLEDFRQSDDENS